MPRSNLFPSSTAVLPVAARRNITDKLSILAWRAVDLTIENGARRYNRSRHLQPLVPQAGPPKDMPEPEATRMVLSGLRRKLGHARRQARATPHHYDLNRHIALLQALRAETRHWRTLQKK